MHFAIGLVSKRVITVSNSRGHHHRAVLRAARTAAGGGRHAAVGEGVACIGIGGTQMWSLATRGGDGAVEVVAAGPPVGGGAGTGGR